VRRPNVILSLSKDEPIEKVRSQERAFLHHLPSALFGGDQYFGSSLRYSHPVKRLHVPPIDTRYWIAITLASVFGTNMGDFYAHSTRLGIVNGLAVLATLAAAVFVMERLDDRRHVVYYWLVIVLIRTGATNIADFLAYRVRVPSLTLSLALVALLCLFGALTARSSRAAAARRPGLPDTGAAYWSAMLTAGVFGTVFGDIAEHTIGETPAMLTLTAVLVVVVLVVRNSTMRMIAVYWATIAVARTAGTAIGDWIADTKALHVGLSLSTLLTGLIFVAVLSLPWRASARGGDRLEAAEAAR
jgi:uncharacterized membrane-anchored protein